ncbi:hypothetical protein [Ramlibacter humi]|uniref:Uncharacterized protein n=1 Tax=Ramlibacter humi TaxID=2530451 RepID=A0A4Z0CB83_9BURK|nr:hypothetical protein [Ramlibacter humi]TFZ08927.1 hypothetical protein EZ216_07235 [Ramlibacter humi]
MTPLSLVEDLLAKFEPVDPREEKFAQTLRELLEKRKFDDKGKLTGPTLNLTVIAHHAGLKLKLVSHEGCALPAARELLLAAMERLSEYSLQVKCDFLDQEVKRLRARLDRYDSIYANRVVQLHKKKTQIEPTPANKYTPDDVRMAAQVLPMDEL